MVCYGISGVVNSGLRSPGRSNSTHIIIIIIITIIIIIIQKFH